MTNTDRATELTISRLAFAALAGVAHGLSFSPYTSGTLQIISLAIAWGLVIGAGPLNTLRSSRAAGLLGWIWGTASFATGIGWLYISMHDIGGLPAPLAIIAVLLLSLYLAAYGALAFACAHFVARSHAAIGVFTLIASWTVLEQLRTVALTGFPWLAIGYAHVDSPLAALAPWLGVAGVGAAAIAIAAAGAVIAKRLNNLRSAWRYALGIMLVLACGPLLNLLTWAEPAGEPVKVQLLQGNVAQSMKFDPNRSRQAMRDYIADIASEPVDLVVLPETAWTIPLARTPADIWSELLAAARRSDSLVAIGAPLPVSDEQRRANPSSRLSNSVATIDSQARLMHRYDKRHLVPFGEFVPPGFRWFIDMMNIPLGDFGRGTDEQALLALKGSRLAFNICYEDLFGAELRIQVLQGANILINLSNIGWFGRSHALTQHLNISRMRAREFARPMLRATNTGATAVIDALGETQMLAPYHERAQISASVQGMTGLTPYSRFGDWPLLLVSGLVLLILVIKRTRTISSR